MIQLEVCLLLCVCVFIVFMCLCVTVSGVTDDTSGVQEEFGPAV